LGVQRVTAGCGYWGCRGRAEKRLRMGKIVEVGLGRLGTCKTPSCISRFLAWSRRGA
jgi:hypothetical protein